MLVLFAGRTLSYDRWMEALPRRGESIEQFNEISPQDSGQDAAISFDTVPPEINDNDLETLSASTAGIDSQQNETVYEPETKENEQNDNSQLTPRREYGLVATMSELAPETVIQTRGKNKESFTKRNSEWDEAFGRLSQHPILTRDQEVKLAKQIEKGDVGAKESLIIHNQRLIIMLAFRNRNRGLPVVDLVQEGNIGLMRAAEKFDWRRGWKFSTYATHWVQQAIQRALENKDSTIRKPAHIHQKARRVRMLQHQIAQTSGGAQLSTVEVAEMTGLTTEAVEQINRWFEPVISLDATVGDETQTPLGHTIASDELPVEVQAMTSVVKDEIDRVLKKIDPVAAEAVRLKYGVGVREMTPAEIAERFRISPEIVSDLIDQGLRSIRAELGLEESEVKQDAA